MPCLAPRHLRTIKPEDFELGKCGGPISPDALYVEIPTAFIFNFLLGASVINTELKQALDPLAEVWLKSVTVRSLNNGVDYRVRLQFPNGRYHSNTRVQVSTYGEVSGRRLLIDPVVRCPEASFIGIELENQTVAVQGVCLAFNCCKRIYLR